MPKDKPNFRDLIGWAIILVSAAFSVGSSWATQSTIKETMNEIKHEVIKHGKDIAALKAMVGMGDK